jgi:hypothetical protein
MVLGALNLGPFSYFQSLPFINLQHSSDPRWFTSGGSPTTTYVGSDFWLTGFANGTNYYCILRQGSSRNYIRTGSYVMKWTHQAGLAVTIDGDPGVTNRLLVSNGRYTFDIDDPQLALLRFRVVNTSGGAINVNDIKICYAAHEGRMDAGELFDPDYLAAVRCSLIRFMDWSFAKSTTLVPAAYADWRTESFRSWAAHDVNNTFPGTVIGKLGTALECDIQVNAPTGATDAAMESWLADIESEYPNGNAYLGFSNEAWNTASSVHAYLRDTKFTGLTAYDGDGNVAGSPTAMQKAAAALADGSAALWAAGATVFGSRMRRVLEGQAANFNQMKPAFEYIDPRSSTRIKNIMQAGDLYMDAPYFEPATTATFIAVTKKWLCENEAYNFTDAQWMESMEQGSANMLPTWSAVNASVAAKNAAIGRSSYECGQHIRLADFEPASVYTTTVDDVNDLLVASVSLVAGFTNGEQAYVSFGTMAAMSVQTRTPYIKLSGTDSLELYSDAALTTRITLSVLGGTHQCDNYTRMVLLDTKIKGLANGTPMRDVYRDTYFPDVFEALGFVHFNHYSDVGDHPAGEQWALTRSHVETLTPRHQWFLDTFGAEEAEEVAQPTSGGGGKRKKKRPIVYDDGYEPEIRKKVVVSKVPGPKVDDGLELQIESAIAERRELISELNRLRKVQQLTIVGIAKIAELTHARTQLDEEIKRLKEQKRKRARLLLQELNRIEQEDEDLRVMTFIASEL